MQDLEHEEWLRDRAAQRNPSTGHITVGGLQTDTIDEKKKTADSGTSDGDEEDDDDVETEGNGSTPADNDPEE